jgi:hypothetical protein
MIDMIRKALWALLIWSFILLFPSNIYAQWQSATNTGKASTGDYSINKCLYRTYGGYEFSVNHRGGCPFSVDVNPESGEVWMGETLQPSFPAGSGLFGGGWESARKTGQQSTGDYSVKRCLYKTSRGYEFSVDYKGGCPYSVDINIESGQVRSSSNVFLPFPY